MESSPGERMSGAGWMRFVLLYAATVTLYLARKGLSVAKGEMLADGSISALETATLETGFLFAYAFGQLVLGPLMEMAGPSCGLSICYGGCALSLAGFANCESISARTLLWTINGLCQAACYPLCIRALAPYLPARQRGQLIGMWTTSQAVGGVVANIAGAAAMASAGWRAAFSPLPAALLAVMAVLLLLGLGDDTSDRNNSDGRSKITSTGAKATARDTQATSSWTVLTSTPGLLSLGLSYFMAKLARYMLLFWLPLFLEQQLGYTSTTAASSAALFDVGAFGGSLISGYLADYSPRSEAVAAAMAFGCAPLCLLLATTQDHAEPLMLLIGVCISGPDTLLGGSATQDAVSRASQPERLTTALLVVNGLGSLGTILQGACVTCLLENGFGWSGVWAICAGLCVVAAVLVEPTLQVAALIAAGSSSSGGNNKAE
eukprot:SAG31_NODE_1105_length_9882_cov_5.270571_3_plen_434_part_00